MRRRLYGRWTFQLEEAQFSMKIAQVCHAYYPHKGGIEEHVRQLSERLAKKFDVEVITADLSSTNKQVTELNGVTIKRFHAIAPNGAYFFAPQLFFYLRKADFDIIHAHNYHAFPAYFASFVKHGRFIFTPHYHGMGSTPFRNVLNKPYKYLGSRIFTRADKIICVSEHEKELVRRNFGVEGKDVEVIPNGLNLREIEEAEPFEFDHNLILYVGRLEKYKNIQIAIRAMAFLPECQFHIIGDGRYRRDLAQLILSLQLEDRVKILSGVSDEEKYRWLKTCSLFINFSGIEAFGMTVLEALAAGKPVLVNEEGGLREFAQKFEGVFPVRVHVYEPDKRDNLKKLAMIMEQKKGEEVNEDLSAYTWDTVAEKTENIYCGALEGTDI